jgi:hypothetical protein
MWLRRGNTRTKVKPDKWINDIFHRECALCYIYKPVTNFSARKKRHIVGVMGQEHVRGFIEKTYTSYCNECRWQLEKQRNKED